ncbi:MAG: alpha/beta hydrolase [Jaaginema sp. PMC 1079.18]|nr:alpha/beta hydrolase [Jaaginema sp. PMC 1080.18]MEC4851454.1 alpha/beta hydrolase [Jaaginema sp. PMC 1079.18]MEC4865958.1 alpha/beta hydrolase [Jaaginema sp. PMC 1078.18]
MTLKALSLAPPEGSPPQHLLIALHGWGANARDLMGLAPYLNLPDCYMLFADAPFPHFQLPGGRAWYALEQEGYPGLSESRTALLTWLRSLPEQTGIPFSRSVLLGFSQGGAMTLDVGLSLPLAGLCVLSGYLHDTPQVSPTPPPVLMAHGLNDPVVPLATAQSAKTTLTQLGVAVDYREFVMGHQISAEVVDVVAQFLRDRFAQNS